MGDEMHVSVCRTVSVRGHRGAAEMSERATVCRAVSVQGHRGATVKMVCRTMSVRGHRGAAIAWSTRERKKLRVGGM